MEITADFGSAAPPKRGAIWGEIYSEHSQAPCYEPRLFEPVFWIWYFIDRTLRDACLGNRWVNLGD